MLGHRNRVLLHAILSDDVLSFTFFFLFLLFLFLFFLLLLFLLLILASLIFGFFLRLFGLFEELLVIHRYFADSVIFLLFFLFFLLLGLLFFLAELGFSLRDRCTYVVRIEQVFPSNDLTLPGTLLLFLFLLSSTSFEVG